jgi:hypothetical protein
MINHQTFCRSYPLVNCPITNWKITMLCSWVNQLFLWQFSIANCLFTRGYSWTNLKDDWNHPVHQAARCACRIGVTCCSAEAYRGGRFSDSESHVGHKLIFWGFMWVSQKPTKFLKKNWTMLHLCWLYGSLEAPRSCRVLQLPKFQPPANSRCYPAKLRRRIEGNMIEPHQDKIGSYAHETGDIHNIAGKDRMGSPTAGYATSVLSRWIMFLLKLPCDRKLFLVLCSH